MSDLAKWNPFSDLLRLVEDVTKIFSPSVLSPWGDMLQGLWGFSVKVNETETSYEVKAEIPGADPDKVDVMVTREGVSFRGEVREDTSLEQEGFQSLGQRYRTFYRAIPFPKPVKQDEAVVHFKDGVLTVTVPKAEPDRG